MNPPSDQAPPSKSDINHTAAKTLTATGKAWRESVSSNCNRLISHYIQILKSATQTMSNKDSVAANNLEPSQMILTHMAPPSLAARAGSASLQAKLAAHNMAVASSHLLDLIRVLKLTLLVNDIADEASVDYIMVDGKEVDVKHILAEIRALEEKVLSHNA